MIRRLLKYEIAVAIAAQSGEIADLNSQAGEGGRAVVGVTRDAHAILPLTPGQRAQFQHALAEQGNLCLRIGHGSVRSPFDPHRRSSADRFSRAGG